MTSKLKKISKKFTIKEVIKTESFYENRLCNVFLDLKEVRVIEKE